MLRRVDSSASYPKSNQITLHFARLVAEMRSRWLQFGPLAAERNAVVVKFASLSTKYFDCFTWISSFLRFFAEFTTGRFSLGRRQVFNEAFCKNAKFVAWNQSTSVLQSFIGIEFSTGMADICVEWFMRWCFHIFLFFEFNTFCAKKYRISKRKSSMTWVDVISSQTETSYWLRFFSTLGWETAELAVLVLEWDAAAQRNNDLWILTVIHSYHKQRLVSNSDRSFLWLLQGQPNRESLKCLESSSTSNESLRPTKSLPPRQEAPHRD